ncbi:MAG: hypothetical protein ACREUG_17175, partial [Steroidobacteraceae bacterium]
MHEKPLTGRSPRNHPTPSADAGEYSIVSDRAFILAARTRCWRCHEGIRVVCIYCESGCVDGEAYEQFTVSNIAAIDEALHRQIAHLSDFRFVHSRDAGGRFLVNRCTRCRAEQADYFLHCEPGGAFFTMRDAPAGAFE